MIRLPRNVADVWTSNPAVADVYVANQRQISLFGKDFGEATVIATCLPSLESVETSLYEALERTGNRPIRALQRLRAVLLTAEQAKLLKAQERDAGLLVARVGYLKDGRAVEFSQSFYRGDIYDFVAELNASS
jgi:GntR family transcriptional regulator